MTLAHDAEEALAEKVRGPQLVRETADFGHDEEIQSASHELGEDVATCGFDLHVEQRCASRQSADELVDDGSEGVLGRGHAHGPGRSSRVERLRRAKEPAEPVEAGRERLAQPRGASREQHLAIRRDEQLIIKPLAELPEAPAHRRLRHAKADRRTRDASLDQKPVQREQQVEVHLLEPGLGARAIRSRMIHEHA